MPRTNRHYFTVSVTAPEPERESRARTGEADNGKTPNPGCCDAYSAIRKKMKSDILDFGLISFVCFWNLHEAWYAFLKEPCDCVHPQEPEQYLDGLPIIESDLEYTVARYQRRRYALRDDCLHHTDGHEDGK